MYPCPFFKETLTSPHINGLFPSLLCTTLLSNSLFDHSSAAKSPSTTTTTTFIEERGPHVTVCWVWGSYNLILTPLRVSDTIFLPVNRVVGSLLSNCNHRFLELSEDLLQEHTRYVGSWWSRKHSIELKTDLTKGWIAWSTSSLTYQTQSYIIQSLFIELELREEIIPISEWSVPTWEQILPSWELYSPL